MALESLIGRAKAAWKERQLAIPDNPAVITELTQALSSGSQTIETCLDLYRRAKKQNTQRWEKVARLIIDRATLRLRSIPAAGRSIDISATRLRKQKFDEQDHLIAGQLGDDPELSLLYKREKVPLERNLFSVTDRFLLPQPPEVLDALAQFSSEQQTDIALAWQLQPHVHWPDILLDHDAPTIIDVILVFPNIEAYSVKADRQAVLNIAEKFSPTEQQTAYEKAGKPVGTWDDIYTYLVVASFPESTTEQIQLLNSEQWQYITLAVLAYGADHVQQLWTEENLLDLKEFDERASSRYYRRDASPAQVLDFIKSLSAVVKSHLPSEVGSGWGLDSPTRPGHSIFNSHGFQGLPEAIAQFQTALYRVPSSRHDALFTVLKQDKYYSGSYNWEHLTEEQVDHFVQYIEITGAQAKVQLDVLISQQKAFTGDRWQLIEQGIQTCQDQGLVIAETDGYDLSGRLAIYERAGTPEQAMTNKFWRQCQEGATAYSTQKGTHAKEYAARERQPGSIINVQQFAEFHQKYFTHNIDAVARLLNLNDTERQIVRQWPQFDATVDLPVIEGIVVHLGSDLTRLDDQTRQRLDQFIALTDDQQKRFLWLDKHIFWLGGNHQGDHAELIFSLAQSAQGEQVQQFLETTGLTGFMPEATLAMVKRPDCAGLYYYLNKEKIQYDQQKVIVGQLITLRDASFPREYDRAGYSAEGNLNTYGEYDGKSSIGHLLEWDPPQLVELARLAIDRHQVLLVELLKLDPIMTREQYLRLLDLAAAERTTHLEYYRDPTQAEIDLIAQRCTLAEQLTGLTLDYSRVSRLKHLSATVWQRLESNSTILGLYLTGQAGSFPEVGLVLPDELLQQPGVWKYNYPAAIWADPEKMRAALVVQERLATAQIKLEPYNAPWEQWVQAQLQAPWLFSGESLACFRTNCDVRLLPQFIELTESDWQTIMPAMMHHHLVYHNDTVEFIERWRNHILLSDEQLSELHRVVETIPWENEDRNPAAWEKARIAFLRKQVEADLPTFAKYVDDSISFWQDIVQLPRSVLRNLEQLSPCTKYVNRYHEQLKNFIATAEHPNFTLVLPLLLQKEHLLPIRLLDRLTPAIMERLQTWPDKLEINYADAADFLADPRAEEILDFAQALRQIFGENFRMSVCDLLIMDVEQDLANLRQLQKDCTLPVTPDHLRRLAPVTSGDMQRTITKLLAMFDYSYKIDFHESVQQLAALDSHLRVAVILAKGSGNFGWGILPYRQELIDTLALTAEQVDELTRACYKSDPGNMPAIDTPAALALLKEPECMAAVLNKYNGEPSAILGEVYSQPAALIKLAYDSWNTVPEYIKQDRQFWELMLEQAPLFLVEHYTERVAEVTLSAESIVKILALGGAGHMNMLVHLNQQGEVHLSAEQLITVTRLYIEKNGDLNNWTADEVKRRLLQNQLAAVACGWRTDDAEQKIVLEQLVAAGLIDEANARPSQTMPMEVEQRLLAALLRYRGAGIQQLDSAVSITLGERVTSPQLVRAVAVEEFRNLSVDTVSEQNWLPAVMAFARTTIDDHQLPQLGSQLTEQVTAAFKGDAAKDICLAELQKLWKQYVQVGEVERMPIQLAVVSGFVDECKGAGPMTQFEALALFIHHFRRALSRSTTFANTQRAVLAGTRQMENRFVRERWSNDDQADYYTISRDILQAAPSLFSSFLAQFQKLSPSDLKRFHEQVFPLVRAQLAVLATVDQRTGEAQYDEQALVRLRRMIRDMTDMGALRQQLVSEMTEKFKTRFGITKIPAQFTPEHVRSLTNSTMYLANMHSRSAAKEQLLGWYLALQINGQWDAYRRGEPLNPADYLTPDNAKAVTTLMRQREQLSPVTAERLHIDGDRLPVFQTMLQTETPNIALGDVETIDVRLGNVIANLHTLEDLDLYPDPLDKQRMHVLLEFGSKPVGTVAAKLYRGIELTAAEQMVCDRMQAASLSPDEVKTIWQDGVKALAVVVNAVRLIEETNAPAEIDTLRGLLQPSADVVAIFNRLGEEFKVTSGAFALTQDLDYLDNIIVKRADELTPEEVTILQEYVGKIRAQVLKLQAVYDQIKTKFGNTRQAQSTTPNELLRTKLAQIDTMINAEAAQQTITSTLTHDWNAIVENIRECLSCTKQGCNNDTDLTFGDSNKFFIYSHTEAQRKGSIADQIVFFEPISHDNGRQEMSFVLDRVYGTCTPFILTNHIVTVFKKYRALKTRFPESTLSILVTDAAMTTGGIAKDQLTARLHEQFGKKIEIERTEAEVDIAQSATGDHYVEFGGAARTAGKRKINGLVIRILDESPAIV